MNWPRDGKWKKSSAVPEQTGSGNSLPCPAPPIAGSFNRVPIGPRLLPRLSACPSGRASSSFIRVPGGPRFGPFHREALPRGQTTHKAGSAFNRVPIGPRAPPSSVAGRFPAVKRLRKKIRKPSVTKNELIRTIGNVTENFLAVECNEFNPRVVTLLELEGGVAI